MHSNTIFGFLVLAFFVHITAQGKLPRYMGFFVGPVSTQTAKTGAVQSSGVAGGGSGAANTAFPGMSPGASSTAAGLYGIGTAASDWFNYLTGTK